MTWAVGSLFSGILGLDWPWLDYHHAWVSEVDPDASAVLAERLPGVPNLGDVTGLDFSKVEPVDVLIGGGFPCQPFSVAGKRLGSDDERYLWPVVLDAVRHLRPGLVVLENAPTVTTRGDGLPRFAGELAEVGYDLRWTSLRASDLGAPHQRRRWLALAHPHDDGERPVGSLNRGAGRGGSAQGGPGQSPGADISPTADTGPGRRPSPDAAGERLEGLAIDEGDAGDHEEGPRGRRGRDPQRPSLLPTPQASDGSRGPDFARQRERRASGSGGDDLTTTVAKLFPTPTAALGLGGNRSRGGARVDEPLLGGIEKLLPTPVTTDANGARRATADAAWGPNTVVGTTLGDVAYAETWGDYAPAVARWAAVMGPPPEPTEGRTLAAPFVEWMMGFPPGWVTDLAPRRPALRMLGNAVLPQVAAAALDLLTDPIE